MRGLLADVNVQGHVEYLRHVLQRLDLWPMFDALSLRVATFADLGLPRDLDDRSLWDCCQRDGWVLLTENRNDDGPTSLQATLDNAWTPGCLPVLTLANKQRFEHSRAYAERVAADVAELLFGVAHDEYRDRPRIYIPLSPPDRDA